MFPYRRTIIHFHSAGVTQRALEIPITCLKDLEFEFVDDFSPYVSSRRTSWTDFFRKRIRELMVFSLEKLGFLARLNQEHEFQNVNLWLYQVRGHFTSINLKNNEIRWLIDTLGLSNSLSELTKNVSVHYRLGDLLVLNMKHPIANKRVSLALERVEDSLPTHFYSDSSHEELSQIFREKRPNRAIKVFNLPTVEVIRACVASERFIGTNSKISIWIALFRLMNHGTANTLLPKEMSENLEILSKNLDNRHLIDFYD